MLADKFIDLPQRAANGSAAARQQVPITTKAVATSGQALYCVHDSQHVTEQPELRGLATQSDGAEGEEILDHVGGHQDQQQCQPVARRSTIEASLPGPENEGSVDHDECQIRCDVDGQKDSADTNGTGEVGYPARELKDPKPASSLNDHACPTVSKMLPDRRLISAMMISNPRPIVRLVSVFHGRPALRCGALGGSSGAGSRTSAAIRSSIVDVFTDSLRNSAQSDSEVTARRLLQAVRQHV
jgi:hypothetical protein